MNMISFTHIWKVVSGRILSSKWKIIFPLLTFSFLGVNSYSQSVNMVVNPVTSAVTVGQNFTVDVNVQFISGNLDVASVHLEFDNTLLAVVSATNAPSIGILPNVSFALQSPATMNTNGRVSYSAGTTGPFPSTNFTVISITFQALQTGSTTLTFRRPPLTPPLTNAVRSGVSILNSVTNGTVNISSVGCTAPTATISAAPTCDANAFNLVLASSPAPTGTAPFDLTINGTTYNNIPIGGIITNFNPPSQRIWPATPAPAPATFEDQALTLGVRFQSSVTGFVRGVRFFSPDDIPVAPGNFTGQLWTAGGTLLASGTFTGVTVDSWNELIFSDPILISAGTTYVASYHTNDIKYAETPGGLTSSVTNGPLTALAGGGLYIYGASALFPTNGNNNNFWVDVIFAANNYTFNLTSVKDALECTNTGSPNLQTLNVTSGECGTLPVSLLSFSATPANNNVTLRWSTSSEINNLGFEIQRSIDGSGGWTTLGFVNGAGNSSTTLNYSYVDENLAASRYYYRLKQIDIDQRFAYSPIVSAVLDGKKTFQLEQNFPNPFRNETIIRFTLPVKSKVNLSLFDMNGRLVKVLVNESKESGTHAVSLSSGMITSGMYYYKLQAGDFSAVKKMTVQ